MPVSACYSCICESIQYMCILSSTPLQFGLKAFCRRHEEVIAEIILQQDVCEGTGRDLRESGPRHRQEALQGRMLMEGQSEDKVKEHVNSDYWNNTE